MWPDTRNEVNAYKSALFFITGKPHDSVMRKMLFEVRFRNKLTSAN